MKKNIVILLLLIIALYNYIPAFGQTVQIIGSCELWESGAGSTPCYLEVDPSPSFIDPVCTANDDDGCDVFNP